MSAPNIFVNPQPNLSMRRESWPPRFGKEPAPPCSRYRAAHFHSE